MNIEKLPEFQQLANSIKDLENEIKKDNQILSEQKNKIINVKDKILNVREKITNINNLLKQKMKRGKKMEDDKEKTENILQVISSVIPYVQLQLEDIENNL
jgi:chromosome segregation ATPase